MTRDPLRRRVHRDRGLVATAEHRLRQRRPDPPSAHVRRRRPLAAEQPRRERAGEAGVLAELIKSLEPVALKKGKGGRYDARIDWTPIGQELAHFADQVARLTAETASAEC